MVIEAWAQDRPVVAATSAGPAALIREGENGLLVPIDDPPALAAALRRLMNDPELRRRLAAGGRASYERDHTEAAVVAKYRAFFEQVAAGR